MIYDPGIIYKYAFTMRGYGGGVTLYIYAYLWLYGISFYNVSIDLSESFR